MRIGLAVVAMTAIIAFGSSAYADTVLKSADGTIEMTLPNGWREAKKGNSNALIHATDGHSARVSVRTEAKENFKDLKAYAQFMTERLKRKFADAEPKTEDVQVGGKPAVRITVMGEARNGKRAGYIITLFEGDKVYVEVSASASAGVFSSDQDMLANLPNQIRMTSAAAPAATPPAAQPAAPAPASAAGGQHHDEATDPHAEIVTREVSEGAARLYIARRYCGRPALAHCRRRIRRHRWSPADPGRTGTVQSLGPRPVQEPALLLDP